MADQKPSCVVLGGSGFIGTNLCRRLLASGHRVRAFGRQRHFPDDLNGVEWYQGDFTDPDSVAAAIETFDIVFHLVHSTMPQASNLDMSADAQRNVIPSITLLTLCSKLDVKRVIFSSSGGTIYGLAQQFPTPETASTDPICAHGVSKLAIEKYFSLYERFYSLDFRVLRVTNPFGPFQVAWKAQGFIAAAVSSALSGQRLEVWGDGSVVRDFVFIDDVVDAFEAAISDSGTDRIYNVGTGEGRSLLEVMTAIERLLEVKLSIKWMPARPLDIPVSIVAIDRAISALGWKPKTSFETGLAMTIDWARQYRARIDRFSR